ncbi:MAG TPA: GNAT family N-acetyltransferase [Candidatus Cybelea sp.]|nr:GNAT family N-acetyltransferase [Candidatus Cybelea sp.]
MPPELTLTDAPDAAAQAAIVSGLDRYNDEQAGFADRKALAVLITDSETKAVIGGLLGRTSLGLLFIDILFVPEALRGKGLGGTIMHMAEAEAKRRGCMATVLFTINFQAPGFYRRHGYSELGEIPTHASGISRFVMTKRLT